MITQKYLISICDYNKSSGEFVRTKGVRGQSSGGLMGCMDKDGYMRIVINNKPYYSHRLAWLFVHGEFPMCIDHINGIRDDNKICNLRNVNPQENMKNKSAGRNNASGDVGVSWFSATKRWRVTIGISGIQRHVGYFKEKEDAILARKEAQKNAGYHENHGRPRNKTKQ